MDTPTKRCYDCGKTLPVTEFWKQKSSRDGYGSYCRQCAKSHRISQKILENLPEGTQRCTKCKQVKPLAEFRERKRKTGTFMRSWCRACELDARIDYYWDNHDEELAREANYRDRNRDTLNAKNRERYRNNEQHREANKRSACEWARNNRDKVNRRKRELRNGNPGKYRKQERVWKSNNPDKVKVIKRRYYEKNKASYYTASHRRKARKRGLPDTFTTTDWRIALGYWYNCCAYCGSQQGLWNPMSADHFIPLNTPNCLGTVPGNMLPACRSCNCSKCDDDPREWAVRKFGKRKAAQILKRINAYFDWLKTQK